MSTKRALAYVYAGYIVRYVSLLILIPFYGRVLGAESYGQVLAAMSLYAVVFTLVGHGFATVGARDIASSPDRDTVTREFGRHLHGRLLMSGPGIVVGLAGTWLSPALRSSPVMGLLAMLFALSHAFHLGWFYQGLGEFRRSILLEVFGFVASTVLIIGFVRGPADNWIVLLSLCVANLAANAMAYRQAGRFVNRHAVRLHDGVALLREATPVFLVGGVAALTVGASSYILSLFAPVVEVGYFGSADRVAAFVVALMVPANQVLLSTVSSRMTSPEDMERGYALMRRALRGMLVCSLIASAVVAASAPVLMPLVLGASFVPGVPMLQGFALMYPFVAFSQVVNMYVLIPMRLDGVAMRVAAVGSALYVVLLFLMARQWHGQGAVVARVTAEVATALMLGGVLVREGLWSRLLRAPGPGSAFVGTATVRPPERP